MKTSVIGAGSTYTPELALHEIDSERLEIVGGPASRMLARQSFAGMLTQS